MSRVKWNGGACPFKDTSTQVKVWLRDGRCMTRRAGYFDWNHRAYDGDGDVVEYEPVDPRKEG